MDARRSSSAVTKCMGVALSTFGVICHHRRHEPAGRRWLRDTISPSLQGVARTPACNGGWGAACQLTAAAFWICSQRLRVSKSSKPETDGEAVARADTLFHDKGAEFSGIEVWDRGRRVERQWHDGSGQIRRWRMKAEEIRTAAGGFADGSARQHMRNSAETYEALANAAEARFPRRKDREPETG